MATHVLEARQVSGFYGPVAGARDVSLGLEAKSALGIVGPNGAGKSTLLKALGGHVRSTGEVLLDGADISSQTPSARYRHGVGFVPQESAFIAGLTVLENIKLSWLLGRKTTSFEDRMVSILDLFPHLKDRQEEPAANLSGGQRQMLAISRGLALDSRILMLDEPTAGLSPRLTFELAEALLAVREREEMSVLLVEQNAAVAKHVCGELYAMSSGTVTWTGRSAELTNELLTRLYLGVEDQKQDRGQA